MELENLKIIINCEDRVQFKNIADSPLDLYIRLKADRTSGMYQMQDFEELQLLQSTLGSMYQSCIQWLIQRTFFDEYERLDEIFKTSSTNSKFSMHLETGMLDQNQLISNNYQPQKVLLLRLRNVIRTLVTCQSSCYQLVRLKSCEGKFEVCWC